MAVYFTDDSTGNDANDGLDNIGVGLATATWNPFTRALTQVGHGYTFSAGDLINITSGTGVLQFGLYEVESNTADTIVIVASSSLPEVHDSDEMSLGSLFVGDITSSDGPWLTIDNAMNNIGAGDTTHVWIRATGMYVENPAIDTAVTNQGNTATFEGYTTTITDDGMAIIQGQLTDTIGTRIHYCFKNIMFDAVVSFATAVTLSSYEIMFRKCKFRRSTGSGVICAQATWFWDCDFEDNGGDGVSCSAMGAFFNCRFYRNTASGIDCSSTVLCWNCTFFSCGSIAIDGGAANESHVIAINCTIDGDAKDTTSGVFKNTTIRGMIAMVNCIVYDSIGGSNGVHHDRDLYLNNLMNSNTNNYLGTASDQEGTDVTDAPDFVDEVAGADYNLNATSPAKGAGHDGNDSMDIGAFQIDPAGAGGGGLLMPNKRGGKQ